MDIIFINLMRHTNLFTVILPSLMTHNASERIQVNIYVKLFDVKEFKVSVHAHTTTHFLCDRLVNSFIF